VVKDIEKRLLRFVPFPLLGDLVEPRGGQRRVDAVEPHKRRAHRRRRIRMVFIIFHRFQLADREAHSRMRAKPYRIVRRIQGAAQRRCARTTLFQ
jgi:hypothetical protein